MVHRLDLDFEDFNLDNLVTEIIDGYGVNIRYGIHTCEWHTN